MGMIKCSSCNCFHWYLVGFLFKHGVCHVTPDPSKRPRRRWSRRMGSLEVMVKSMLDLRQLETFSHKKNGSFNEKERQSSPSQVCMEPRWREEGAVLYCADAHRFLQLGNRAKRHQPWLSKHSSKVIRDHDGAAWYPEENPEDASLRGRYRTPLLRAPGLTVTATLTGNKTAEGVCLCLLFLMVFHLSLAAVKHQRSGGGGAGPQDAVEGHVQWQPGNPQPRQRLLCELWQQGVQPGWWALYSLFKSH